MKLLLLTVGICYLASAQKDDSLPDVLTIYSLVPNNKELNVESAKQVASSDPIPPSDDENLPPLMPTQQETESDDSSDSEDSSEPSSPKPPGRFLGNRRFPGPFGPRPGRRHNRFPPFPFPFRPGHPDRRPFPPGSRPYPPRPEERCERWSEWQKASCFWPNQTLEELPLNCRVVPVKKQWPNYLKKFVEAKVMEGYNMIVDEFKRRGAPQRCGFCSRSFECRIRNETSSSSRFCPLKEVRPVSEDCGDSDACIINEEKGGCPPPLFLQKADRLNQLNQMIQKKQYKKFVTQLLEMKKMVELDGKPENIRFKRDSGFNLDYSPLDLAYYNKMTDSLLYNQDFHQRRGPGARGPGGATRSGFSGSRPYTPSDDLPFASEGRRGPGNFPGFTGPRSFGSPDDLPFSPEGRRGPGGAGRPRFAGPGSFSSSNDFPSEGRRGPGHAGETGFRGPRPFNPTNDFPFGPESRRGPGGAGHSRTAGPGSFGPSDDFPFGSEGRHSPGHAGASEGFRGPRPGSPSNDFFFKPEGRRGPGGSGRTAFAGQKPRGPSNDFPFRPEGQDVINSRRRRDHYQMFNDNENQEYGRPSDASVPQESFGHGPFGPRPFGPSDDFPFGPTGHGRHFPARPFGPRPFGPHDDFPFGPSGHGRHFPPRPFGPRPFGPHDDFPFGPSGHGRYFPPRPFGPRPFGPHNDFPFGPSGHRRHFPPRPFGPRPFLPPMPFGKSFNNTGSSNLSENNNSEFEPKKLYFHRMRFDIQDENKNEGKMNSLPSFNKRPEVEGRQFLANLIHGTTCASVNHKCLCCCGHYIPNVDTGKCEDLRMLLPGIEDVLDKMDEDNDTSVRQPIVAVPLNSKKEQMNKPSVMRKMEKPSTISDF